MPTPIPDPPSVIVMGVSGVGKTVVSRALAERLGIPFYDADDFHPPANVKKMATGQPLNDDDRHPWLLRLNALLHEQPRCVLACSALRLAYRDALRTGLAGLRFVYLAADFDTIAARMKSRAEHYMPPKLLQSQFDALEPPTVHERDVVTINAAQPLIGVVDDTVRLLQNMTRPSDRGGNDDATDDT